MKAVGIRELKNRLSEYLHLVRNGEVVLVTDRGVLVAELRPPGTTPIDHADPVLETLARRGNATVGAPNRPDLYPTMSPVATPETAEKLLAEERGGR